MRRALLVGSFLALVVAVVALWTWRFQWSPGTATWHLNDIRAVTPAMPGVEWVGRPDQPHLRLNAGNPPVAIRLVLPGMAAADHLHLRFRLAAHGLQPGREKWQDGRFLVEWHAPDGSASWENYPVGSLRFDHQSGMQEMVIQPQHPPAVPALRLEHLGLAGMFELSDLEITVVEERAVWKIGCWVMVCGWWVWGIAVVRSWPIRGWWRPIAAATVWLVMGICCVIPGPWKNQRPMVTAFQLGASRAAATELPDQTPATTAVPPPRSMLTSGPIPALGTIPNRGSWILLVKQRLEPARPLLHALLFFAPCWITAWWVGRKPTLWLAVLLAVAMELAEIAFGYGFNGGDVFDLLCDAAGIALALRLPLRGGPLSEHSSRRRSP